MDKILILGAGEFQLRLIERAKERNIYTVVMSIPGDYPGMKVADKAIYHDATDREYVLKVAREEGVKGIASDQGEIFVTTIAYACEKLNLPGNPLSVAEKYTNKGTMREAGRSLGVPTIESYVVSTLEEAKASFLSIGTAAIIKPVDGYSSRGVYKINSIDDLDTYFDEARSYSKHGEVIIERFIDGRVLEVDSITYDGNVKPLMHGEIWDFSVDNVFASNMRLYPITEEADSLPKLLEYDKKINEGFGIVHGITHNEYILEKKTGEIYLIEAALRSGGAFVGSAITRLQTGLDTTDFIIDAAMGTANGVPEFETARCHCGTLAFYLPLGTVLSVGGLEEVEALDCVYQTTFHKLREGIKSETIQDKDQRQLIVVHADSRSELMDNIDMIRKMINIQVKTERGIEGPIWK